jgi:hypothetical protein
MPINSLKTLYAGSEDIVYNYREKTTCLHNQREDVSISKHKQLVTDVEQVFL